LTDLAVTNGQERLLLTILRSFEALAADQYHRTIGVLLGDEKHHLLEQLDAQVPTDEALETTDLAPPVKHLLTLLRSQDKIQVLIVQGLILELLGQTIYKTVSESAASSPAMRRLCDQGLHANAETRRHVVEALRQEFPQRDNPPGADLLDALIARSGPVLDQLNTLGEGLDQHFGEAFGIHFADLMAEFASELLVVCTGLGADRRRLVGFLTRIMMAG